MTFLAPSVLWLLSAIAIPISIHLLSMYRLNKIEFSTIRYIKELKTNSIRKVQIQKFIILLIRIFFIASLVMMMARPVTHGFMPGWLSAEQESKLIVVVDNSASMSAEQSGWSFLERSKSSLMTIIPQFDKQTDILITQTCPPKVVFSGLSNDPELRNSIRSINATVAHDDIWQAINKFLTDKIISQPIKECLVFSDMMYGPDSSFFSKKNNIDEWKFYFIQPGSIKNNLGISNVEPINRIKTLNQLVKLNARVRNSGVQEKPNTPLELVFNNQRVGQVLSGFETDKEKEFLFQAFPFEVGILEGSMVLPRDDYEYDNNWYLSMPIMDQIRCSIIGSELEEIEILEMILKSIDPNEHFLMIEKKAQASINRLFLDDIDVLIIHNPKILTEQAINDLNNFFDEGGGLIWFQGYHDKFKSQSELLSRIGFPSIENLVDAGQGFFNTRIKTEDSDIFQDIYVRNVERELPEVYKYVKPLFNFKHKVHLELNNNDPLLVEFSKGSGNVFYFSSILDLRWNDMPIRGMMIPLLYRLTLLTGTDEINTAPVLIDEPKWILIEESKLRNDWEVMSPSGKVEMIVPQYDREGLLIKNTKELGIYKVYTNGEKFTSFPTRLHHKEYINESIKQRDIQSVIDSKNMVWITIEDDFSNSFMETRQGKSLWKMFLLLALIFLLLETIIGSPNPKSMKNIMG